MTDDANRHLAGEVYFIVRLRLLDLTGARVGVIP